MTADDLLEVTSSASIAAVMHAWTAAISSPLITMRSAITDAIVADRSGWEKFADDTYNPK